MEEIITKTRVLKSFFTIDKIIITILLLSMLVIGLCTNPEDTFFIDGNLNVKVQTENKPVSNIIPRKEIENSALAYNEGDITACVFVKVSVPHMMMITNQNTTVDMALFDYSYVQDNGCSEYNCEEWTDISQEVYGENYDGFSHVFAYTKGTDSMIPLKSGESTECVYNKIKVADFRDFAENPDGLKVLNLDVEVHACEFGLSKDRTPAEVWTEFLE